MNLAIVEQPVQTKRAVASVHPRTSVSSRPVDSASEGSSRRASATRLALRADVAADVMKPSPVPIGESVPLGLAVAFLTDSGFSAVPVVDNAGKPVGVLSRTDVLNHFRSRDRDGLSATNLCMAKDSRSHRWELWAEWLPSADADYRVRDVMSPAVFSVAPDESIIRVIAEMVAFGIHRLFVVDSGGLLVGVISASDILRKLRAVDALD